ncbi:hypothetical protein YH66_09805 [[Brevibacterium] flavum]|uniref:Uncharacterized protein n=1 Tax=[Brevibacterium] flavum TaxID=92706 RepID=A0A0F6Z622_9CORY|nr:MULTISPECIES: hypothetical protein [Corynebacterium]AKF27821.1 hypothetical protein YH66_09805 [[Brevibacterium] flavum]ANE08655.1 hypothetical protein A3654_09865 [Corynebacterium glutamicum]AST21068.1 hypothetical protein CEY17_09945 [Corynebacterium glutamicum ATCC 14067]KEI23578.1 hypothetical protein KIQ_013730 [Corynebacterium glutamicum ATCC 14067]KIH73323.1 hypothetical protein SD36_09835 [Corynebacterium glutamicum]
MSLDANTQKSTTAQQLDELVSLAKRLGECFDSIALDEQGKWHDRLTDVEEDQLKQINAVISRVTRQIREVIEEATQR